MPLFFADQPYVYAGNNPLTNVNPSGQRWVATDTAAAVYTPQSTVKRILHQQGQQPKKPDCNKTCLERGKRALAFVSLVLAAVGGKLGGASLVDDLTDLSHVIFPLLGAVALVLGGDFEALTSLIGSLAHVVRDILDIGSIFDSIFVGAGYPSPFGQMSGWVHGISAALDFLTPIADVLSSLGGLFFNPLAAAQPILGRILYPLLNKAIKEELVENLVPWLLKQAFGQGARWLVNGTVNALQTMSPQIFCATVGYPICHS